MDANPPLILDAKIRNCKICDSPAAVYGALDFSTTHVEGAEFPASGWPITYNRCDSCGTLFSCSLDAWNKRDFATHVYNQDFYKIDPVSLTGERARGCAEQVAAMFGDAAAELSILDYGGGQGFFASRLKELGIVNAHTYDPYIGVSDMPPGGSYDVVTAFEVLEHSIQPLVTIKDLADLVKPDGILLFSTTVLPPDFDGVGLSWWYVCPRGGHLTIYSKQALKLAFGKIGYSVTSFNEDTWHIAYRDVPPFARRFVQECGT